MKKYYPKGYRKKRQRENLQRATGFFVITLLVIGAAVTLGWAAIKLFKPGDPDKGTDELVAKTEQIREQKNEAEASQNPPATTPPAVPADAANALMPGMEDAPEPVKLADIKSFEQSFPEIGIQLLKSNEPATLAEDESQTFVPEGERLTPNADETPVPADEGETETRPAPPVMPDSVRPGPPVSREPQETPPAPPRERETPPAESGGGSNTDGSQSESGDGGSAGVAGKYVYSVYAGIWEDKNSASKRLDDLSGVGYAAKIIERDESGKKRFFILVQDKIGEYTKAKEIQSDLKDKGFGEAFVTKRDG